MLSEDDQDTDEEPLSLTAEKGSVYLLFQVGGVERIATAISSSTKAGTVNWASIKTKWASYFAWVKVHMPHALKM